MVAARDELVRITAEVQVEGGTPLDIIRKAGIDPSAMELEMGKHEGKARMIGGWDDTGHLMLYLCGFLTGKKAAE
jgi:hypothetical protein